MKTFVAMMAVSFYEVLVLMYGWTWHAVPLGAPALSYWTCFALLTILGTATSPVGSMRRWHTSRGGSDTDITMKCALEHIFGLGMIHAILWLISIA